MVHVSRRSALTIIAACGAAIATRRAWAVDASGRVIYPVAVPVYQTQFVADRIGYFKEAGLDCKLIQGGSGVKTREIIASSQGDIGIGDITHPMQLSNHGRAGRVLMPVDTRSSSVMFIWNPPSPATTTTGLSGKSILAAIAAESPAPIVASALSRSTEFCSYAG